MWVDEFLDGVTRTLLGPYGAGEVRTATAEDPEDLENLAVPDGPILRFLGLGGPQPLSQPALRRAIHMSAIDSPDRASSTDLRSLHFTGNVDPNSAENDTVQIEVEAQRDCLIHAFYLGDTESTGKAIHASTSSWLGGDPPTKGVDVAEGEGSYSDTDGHFFDCDMTQLSSADGSSGGGFQDDSYILLPTPVNWDEGVTLNMAFNALDGTSSAVMDATVYYTVADGGLD